MRRRSSCLGLSGAVCCLVLLSGCGSSNGSGGSNAGSGGAQGGADGGGGSASGGTEGGGATGGVQTGTGGETQCPPCVPPPRDDCVGQGPCGCGPYTCPGDDDPSDGVPCGEVTCAAGLECCNALQGTCVEPGMLCAQ